MTDERPRVDQRDPADAIDQMVAHVLELAGTWLTWDGLPIGSGRRSFTPHKALRRVADHMVDHLTQLQAYTAGVASPIDRWHGSAMTTFSDMAPLTRDDLDEARSRLERLALLWRLALADIPPDQLDRADRDEYTPREMAFCAVASTEYADALGELS